MSRNLSRFPRQEPGGSPELSTRSRSPGGHFRWYSAHIHRDSFAVSPHFSAAACSLATARCTVTDSSAETATRRSA